MLQSKKREKCDLMSLFKSHLKKLFFPFLWKYSWHAILYLLQSYNTVIWHLYTLKFITRLSILTICHHMKLYNITDYIPYAVHYISILTYFIIGKFVFFNSLTRFSHPPPPLLWKPLFSVSVGLLLFCFVHFF